MSGSHVSTRPGTRLSAELTRKGGTLLHAQCWAWGQDVKRPAGNLLLEHGFSRLRPPSGETGCSQYSLQLADGSVVRLWGFGVYIGRERGLYLNRFDFVPRRAVLQNQWTPARLAKGRREIDPALLLTLVAWFAEYERWVESVAGVEYRRGIFAGWPGADEPLDLALDWSMFEAALRRLLAPEVVPDDELTLDQ